MTARFHNSRMPPTMAAILDVVMVVLRIYTYIIIASAIFSWLYAFGVINPRNPVVAQIGQFLYAVTEPVYRRIRRFMPNFGPVDLSPIAVLLLIFLIQQVIVRYLYPNVF